MNNCHWHQELVGIYYYQMKKRRKKKGVFSEQLNIGKVDRINPLVANPPPPNSIIVTDTYPSDCG